MSCASGECFVKLVKLTVWQVYARKTSWNSIDFLCTLMYTQWNATKPGNTLVNVKYCSMGFFLSNSHSVRLLSTDLESFVRFINLQCILKTRS